MTILTNVAKTLLLSSALLALLLPHLVAAQGSSSDAFEATYRVTFEGNWTKARNHPTVNLPDGAHFSPLVGGVHNSDVTFWAADGTITATLGIKRMAELGQTDELIAEVQTEIDESPPDALETILRAGNITNTETVSISPVTVNKDFPLITLVSMIAPSSDWFVGVSGLPMLDGDEWRDSVTVELFPYDAGTEQDNNIFSLNNNPEMPPEPIKSITGETPFNTNSLGTLTFTRIQFTDLHLTKSVEPQTDVAPQSQVTYTVVLSNGGDIVAGSSMFTDTLPSNVDFASFVEQPGGATGSGGAITWTGDVPLGTPVTFTYVATYTGLEYGATLTNTAEVAHSSGNRAQDSASFTVQSGPMLAIAKSAPNAVKLNEPVTYTLTVMNSGPATATNVVVTDTLPAGANFVSADKGVTPISDTLEWQMGDLPGSSMMDVSFVVTAGMTMTLVNDSYGARADGGLTVSGSTAVQTEVNSEGVSSKKLIYLPLILKNAQPSDGGDEHSADLDFADILIE